MRILITGGAGFIGSHLAEALLDGGHQVYALDDLSTGSIDNINHLKGNPNFHYTIDTVFNDPLVAEMVDRADVIFHLAAAVGVKLIVERPVHTIETNVHGTEVILRHAAKKKKLVFIASTSEVYGKSAKVPFNEETDLVMGATTRHRWAYACSKALDEFLALAYWKETKQPVIVMRFFNTVGPRQTGQYGMVVPTFVRQALSNEPITVFGDGTQQRSFTYVGDVVGALLKLMVLPSAIGEVFNVGNTEEVTIRGLAERIKARTGSTLGNRHDSLRPGLRGRLRGHAPARARSDQDQPGDRLRAGSRARRDHRSGRRREAHLRRRRPNRRVAAVHFTGPRPNSGLAGRSTMRQGGTLVQALNKAGTLRAFSVHFVNGMCIMGRSNRERRASALTRFGETGSGHVRPCDWPCRRPQPECLRCSGA